MPYKDPEKRKACAAKSRRLHPEPDRAAARRYAVNHPDRVLAYRAAHLAETAARSKAWRAAHPERNYATSVRSRRKGEERLRELKADPCSDCGVRFPPVVMDFDHVRGEKKFNIGQNARHKDLLEEIAKCDLVCSNCHRIRTAKSKGWPLWP